MSNLFKELRTSLVALGVLTVLTGVVYPLLVLVGHPQFPTFQHLLAQVRLGGPERHLSSKHTPSLCYLLLTTKSKRDLGDSLLENQALSCLQVNY